MNSKLTADRAMQAQLDRLVSGELAENDRRSLLAWLDEDYGRWRTCALAFLEAQNWEAAAVDWPAPEGQLSGKLQPPASIRPIPKVKLGRALWREVLAASAAAILVFAAGHLSARFWSPRPADQSRVAQSTAGPSAAGALSGPLMASVSVRTNLNPNVQAQLQVPVTSVATSKQRSPVISDYERKQWEKRGFELQEELRYLPAKLPDGSDVLVPINKVQVKFKKTPMS